MAGTYFAEINDLFMQIVADYRLTALFNTSEADFNTFMEAWMQYAINDFSICDQSLAFSSAQFTESLTVQNKIILATLMMKWWLQKNVNDITQMNLHVLDKDFKIASEAQNLREKVSYLNIIKEQCSQLLNDYGYSRVDWDEWFNQDFAS
jgi:hypothetical protein